MILDNARRLARIALAVMLIQAPAGAAGGPPHAGVAEGQGGADARAQAGAPTPDASRQVARNQTHRIEHVRSE
jgi:hypothetical protein